MHLVSTHPTMRYQVGDIVGILGSGMLVGLIVDFWDHSSYVVAFGKDEFVFHESIVYKR